MTETQNYILFWIFYVRFFDISFLRFHIWQTGYITGCNHLDFDVVASIAVHLNEPHESLGR